LDELAEKALDNQRKRYVPIPLRLIAALVALIGIGAGLLLLPGMTTQPITFMDALFTATSAAAVTGLTVLPTSTTFTRAGQWVILLLMQFGGLGFVVIVVLTLRLLGRRISLVDRLAVSSSLGLASSGAVIRILLRTVALMLVIEGTGALVLWLHWSRSGLVSAADAPFYALFHAVAAFCNAGFDLFSGQPQFAGGIPADAVTLVTLGLLVLSGGLGIPVYMDLLHRGLGRRLGRRNGHVAGRPVHRLTLHTRLALWSALALVLLGWIGLLISEYRLGGVLSELPLGDRVLRAWFQSVSARTAGFAGFADFGGIDEASQLLLMCLMFIGSAPASMGGGITTGTLAVLTMAMWSLGHGYDTVRAGRRAISMATVWRAVTVLIVSLAVVMVATWLLLLDTKLAFSPTIFEVVSAFSTTGLSLGITPELDTPGRLILIALMFWGRLGAVTIMLALFRAEPRKTLVKYPEEVVLVG
jgi:trk system potassium uptake protein TrkH